jgi:hypothetical protein
VSHDVLSFIDLTGFAPSGALLSFASPKESKQRKGDPTAMALRAALSPVALVGRSCELAPPALRQQPRFFRPIPPLFGIAEGELVCPLDEECCSINF